MQAWLVVLAVVALWARSARADDTHYQDFIIGGRSIALGGAFCSIADDSTGVYFNPAGLVDSTSGSLQVSTSLYGFERGTIGQKTLPAPGVPDFKTAFTDLIVIPASAGFANTFGEKDEAGRASQAIGATVVIPSYRSSSPGSIDDGDTSYQRRTTDRSIWAGVGYARRLDKRLSVGLSAFYVLRSVTDNEQLTYAQDTSSTQTPFETISSDIAFFNGSLLLVGGAKLALDPYWRLGLSMQSPSLHVHSNGTIKYTRAISDPGSSLSSVERVVLDDLRINTKQSPTVRFGISRVVGRSYTLSADLTAHLPVSYTLVDVSAETRARLPFATEIERRAVVNLNLGAEYVFAEHFSVAGGFYTDFSSAPSIPDEVTTDRLPHVDLYGTTASVSYFGEHLITRLGVLYSFGSGKDVLPTSDQSRLGEGTTTFIVQELTQSFFYVFVSSTFRF